MKEVRNHRTRYGNVLLAAALIAALAAPAMRADEGMWTFDNPPLKLLKEKYGFEPSKEWLDHIRLSSVRFNDGGSGSFVSADGLVLTNHHVALGQLQKNSTKEKDYVNDGFLARTMAEEMKSPDLELNVLVSYEDVTARVAGSVKPGMDDKAALKARQAEIAKIEKDSTDQTGFRSDVVPLYQGGEYWLYRYKKYTDVRLVIAPEQQAAFFGGDPDNFTFPRHDMDFALFRVYENDKPVHPAHYLKWNAKGAADGELVFVSGHPGSTDRLQTVDQLKVQRDHFYPMILKDLNRWLDTSRKFAAQGPEQSRQALNRIFSLENSLKAFKGEYQGLLDKNLMAKKEAEEKEFRAKVAANPEWNGKYSSAWAAIAIAEQKYVSMLKQQRYRVLRGVRLPNLALTLVQYVSEVKKPDGERLDGFHEAELESLKFRMFSPAPVYPAFEQALIEDSLKQALEELGPGDEYVKTVLGTKSPAELARELVTGTKLGDPAVRKQLVEGGEAAVAASTDPLIVMARKIDPISRRMKKWNEENVQSVLTPAGEKIGQARFAVYGKTAYPDATFTLRLSYGTVKGYPMNGTIAQPFTTFYGLYDRAYGFGNKSPWDLPKRYQAGRDKLNLGTPLNFVSDNDIIGGNSGSPVTNRAGEIVGLIFDGNIESLVGNYVFDGTANRAVSVHTGAITEVMRKLYDAGHVADELEGKAGPR